MASTNFENGLYTNQQEIITINGDGETLWDKTISESFAYIKNNTPYYLDYYSIDNTENDFDFIKRLHAVIVSKCSRELDTQNLLELFNIISKTLSVISSTLCEEIGMLCVGQYGIPTKKSL